MRVPSLLSCCTHPVVDQIAEGLRSRPVLSSTEFMQMCDDAKAWKNQASEITELTSRRILYEKFFLTQDYPNNHIFDLRRLHLTSLPDHIARLPHIREVRINFGSPAVRAQNPELAESVSRRLTMWCIQPGLSQQERDARVKASNAITECAVTGNTTLQLADFGLSELPDRVVSLPELAHVEHINVNRNRLTSLPDLPRLLPNLRSINASTNQIQRLSSTLADWAQTHMFDLEGNPAHQANAPLPEWPNRQRYIQAVNNRDYRGTLPDGSFNEFSVFELLAERYPRDKVGLLQNFVSNLCSRSLDLLRGRNSEILHQRLAEFLTEIEPRPELFEICTSYLASLDSLRAGHVHGGESGTCGDGNAIQFMNLMMSHRVWQLSRSGEGRQALVRIGMEFFRFDLLNTFIQNFISENPRRFSGSDIAEQEIYFLINVARQRGLPDVVPTQMIHTGCVRANQNDVNLAVQYIDERERAGAPFIEYLSQWDPWRRLLNDSYSDEIVQERERIYPGAQGRLDAVESRHNRGEINEGQYNQESQEIMHASANAEKAAYIAITRRLAR
jgi:hypothetical protein